MPFVIHLFVHVFNYAESYTILLSWIVVPLGFFACYTFFQNHFEMWADELKV